MNNSNIFKLNWLDIAKAALMAGLAIIVSSLYTSLTATPVHFPTWAEFIVTLKLAGGTAFVYILKQLLTNSDGQPLSKENK
jgi:hypothetical protein